MVGSEPDMQAFFQSLARPITDLPGVGSKLSEKISDLIGGSRWFDLVFHLPHRWVDRTPVDTLSDLIVDEIQTFKAVVDRFERAPRGSKVQKVRLADETGFATLVFFNARGDYLEKTYPVGREVLVSGKIEDFHGSRQVTHPDYVVSANTPEAIPRIEPIYPLTQGMTNRRLVGWIKHVMDELPATDEWIDHALLKQEKWPSIVEALRSVHFPQSVDPLPLDGALARLAYDEALARATRFHLARSQNASSSAPIMRSVVDRDFLNGLPFAPTGAQKCAMDDIRVDVARTTPMRRMVQGDVGAGKTVVAAYACALAAKSKYQAAVMAPTEVLARQLQRTLSDLLTPIGIKVAGLTGRDKGAERKNILAGLVSGKIDVVCGTHALFQDAIEFRILGLTVIDEQHRFGVRDRTRLIEKGVAPHRLIMSATPIPRSLAMTLNGDVDVSILDEKPAGRKPVDTRVISESRMDDVLSAVDRATRKGEQVFWVCPRVDDEDDDRAAISRHALLADMLTVPVGLVHGRMTAKEKDETLEVFKDGQSKVLVATTVIEVGVDVPAATIMVIEGADTFGLAQLHQLRGRVGRGSENSFCLLVYRPPLGETAKKRLETLRQSEDGFHIAEVDFKLRGPGDILGKQQSGLPDFRAIDLQKHAGLLNVAKQQVELDFTKSDAPRLLLLEKLQKLFYRPSTAPKPP